MSTTPFYKKAVSVPQTATADTTLSNAGSIIACAVEADGFTLSQTDHAGVTTTDSRTYTATGMVPEQTDGRSNTTVATRSYAYDTLGRPSTRSTAKDGATVNDSFGYNSRSELSTATVNNAAYSYDYDNIGNRETAQEAAESATTYESNNLNQYTAIGDFEPTYDDAGNQTLVKTSTGIWSVVYDAENRPISFTNAESATVVECTYDYMGRRATKKVTVNGAVTLHHRYLYRGYLQIACCDLTRTAHPCLWLITWDPSQPTATRPLAIQKDGTWYTYGWDLTKNICEVFGQHGYIRTNYTYSPFGQVTATGDVTQPIQWSSEYHDIELALVYYNYRHYNPSDGRWLGRDYVASCNLYYGLKNSPTIFIDLLGLIEPGDINYWGTNEYDVKNNKIIPIAGKNISKGNCYRYAFNDPTDIETDVTIRKTPWAIRLYDERSCQRINAYVLSKSDVRKKNEDEECPKCTYEVTLHIHPAENKKAYNKRVRKAKKEKTKAKARDLGDYHWYRKDSNGTWSHKRGYKEVEVGLTNPKENAEKYGYTIHCKTHYCVKEGGVDLD